MVAYSRYGEKMELGLKINNLKSTIDIGNSPFDKWRIPYIQQCHAGKGNGIFILVYDFSLNEVLAFRIVNDQKYEENEYYTSFVRRFC